MHQNFTFGVEGFRAYLESVEFFKYPYEIATTIMGSNYDIRQIIFDRVGEKRKGRIITLSRDTVLKVIFI